MTRPPLGYLEVPVEGSDDEVIRRPIWPNRLQHAIGESHNRAS